jgi:mono/diheme cytochrome c family protein
LFATNCSVCHGALGEGGPNPVRQGDIIAPISSAEYLKTRDDATLGSIIAQGQPNFGMSPFGSAYGGPLEDDQINALVSYIRTWEQNPPVELPPEVNIDTLSLESPQIYQDLCSQCHGDKGEGKIGPSFLTDDFITKKTDQDIFDAINQGHKTTAMIGWGEILSAEQIQGLVDYIRILGKNNPPSPAATSSVSPTFTKDILPIFQKYCNTCHGELGGWDGSTYESSMTSGDHGPVIVPGDKEGSLLAQKILGTHSEGSIMPPTGKLPDAVIQIILDWIAAGALEN